MLTRVARDAGLPHTTPHQLRHTYATALVNAGVSLQSLMALLGHVSAEMSLRYGRLFDATVKAEYERALTAAKAHLGIAAHRPARRADAACRCSTGTGKKRPRVKARLAGGFCVRAQAQGPCAYANICEHCPNFRTDTGYLPVLAAQRADAETLAARRRSPRLGQRSRTPPPPHRTPRRAHPPGAGRMTPRRPTPPRRRRLRRTARSPASPSPSTTSPPAPDLAAPPSTATPNCEPSSKNTAPAAAKRTPSPDLAAEIAHLRTALDAVAANVRRHEEELRKLRRSERRA